MLGLLYFRAAATASCGPPRTCFPTATGPARRETQGSTRIPVGGKGQHHFRNFKNNLIFHAYYSNRPLFPAHPVAPRAQPGGGRAQAAQDRRRIQRRPLSQDKEDRHRRGPEHCEYLGNSLGKAVHAVFVFHSGVRRVAAQADWEQDGQGIQS